MKYIRERTPQISIRVDDKFHDDVEFLIDYFSRGLIDNRSAVVKYAVWRLADECREKQEQERDSDDK